MKIFLILLCLLFFACPIPTKPVLFDNIGTVVYKDFSMGFYGIITDDSTRYFPFNLKKRFMKNGMRITFNFTISKEQNTIVMWGTAINITRIKKIKR